MKRYSNPVPEPDLPTLGGDVFQTPKTIRQCLHLQTVLGKKIDPLLSSPTRNCMESLRKGNEQILRIADIQQNNLTQIQLATKETLQKKATNRYYIPGKGPLKARDSFKQIAEKEARKAKRAPKSSLKIPVEDEDDSDDEYFIDHPELEGFDFGVTDMEVGVPDPFKAQEEMIRFN
jgi:hypothetical protein